jgi:sirohydrochlorin cobaltochelatase
MNEFIILVAHGAPPRDFPRAETGELFALHGQMEQAQGTPAEKLRLRHHELEARMRAWPRTPANDPFWAASQELGTALAKACGRPVIVAFNEFCAPTIAEAISEAVARGATSVVATTPMLTAGGEHAGHDIPAALELARKQYPGVAIRYAWPFPGDRIAAFLAENLKLPA